MGERRPCKAEVTGSNPVFSIREIKELHGFCAIVSDMLFLVMSQ